MGLKLRIHPLAAAIADEQFDNLDEILNGRRNFANKMMESLQRFAGLSLPSFTDLKNPGWYAFVFQYNASDFEGLSLEKFYQALKAEGCIEVDRPTSTAPLLKIYVNPCNSINLFRHVNQAVLLTN